MLGCCAVPGPGPTCSPPLTSVSRKRPLLLLLDFTLRDLLLGRVLVSCDTFRGLPRAPCLSADSERSRVVELLRLTGRADACVL